MVKRNIISSSVGLVLASGLILSTLVTDNDEVKSESNESKQSKVEQSIQPAKKETNKLKAKPVVIEVERQKQPVLTQVSKPQQTEQKELTQVAFDQPAPVQSVPVQSTPIQVNQSAKDTAFQVVLPQEESPTIQTDFIISPAGPTIEKSEVTENTEEKSFDQGESTEQLASTDEELENTVQAAEKAHASASIAQAELEEAQFALENLSIQEEVVDNRPALVDAESTQEEISALEREVAEAREIAEEARIQAVAAQNDADAAVEVVSESINEEQVIIDGATDKEMVEVLPENAETSIETVSAKVELQALADEKLAIAKQTEADLQVKESTLIDVQARLEESRSQLAESKNTVVRVVSEEERLAAEQAVTEAEERVQKENAEAEKSAQEKAEAEAAEAEAQAEKEEQAEQTANNGNIIIDNAKKYQRISYSWGGTTTAGMDCSGFTQKVYKDSGITIPRTTGAQKAAASAVNSPGIGDLVFFSHDGGATIGHVGIYTGNGQFIGSQSSTGVAFTDVQGSYWGPRLVGYGRY